MRLFLFSQGYKQAHNSYNHKAELKQFRVCNHKHRPLSFRGKDPPDKRANRLPHGSTYPHHIINGNICQFCFFNLPAARQEHKMTAFCFKFSFMRWFLPSFIAFIGKFGLFTAKIHLTNVILKHFSFSHITTPFTASGCADLTVFREVGRYIDSAALDGSHAEYGTCFSINPENGDME